MTIATKKAYIKHIETERIKRFDYEEQGIMGDQKVL